MTNAAILGLSVSTVLWNFNHAGPYCGILESFAGSGGIAGSSEPPNPHSTITLSVSMRRWSRMPWRAPFRLSTDTLRVSGLG